MTVFYSVVSELDVLAIYYDPIIEHRSPPGKLWRLHQVTSRRWSDPSSLTRSMISDIERVSGHAVRINLIEEWLGWPPHADPDMDFTNSNYPCYSGIPRDGCFPDRGRFGYQRMFDTIINIDGSAMSIQDAVDNHLIDEVWVWADPTSGTWESAMAGDDAYYINGGPIAINDLDRRIVVMGWSFERGLGEAQEALSHRIEDTLARTYGGRASNESTCAGNRLKDTYDRRFGRLDACLTQSDKENGEIGGVGIAHKPVNGVVLDPQDISSGYDLSNDTVVRSEADEWFRFPNLRDHPPFQWVNCKFWNCNPSFSNEAYQQWMWERLPRYRGRVPTATPGGASPPTPTPTGTHSPGTFNNFWVHLFNPDCFP